VKKIFRFGLSVTLISYVILHFITYFWEVNYLMYTIAIIGVMLFVLTLLTYKLTMFKLPVFLLSLAFLILIITNNLSIDTLIISFVEMKNIIGLLTIAPVIGWVFSEKPYIEMLIIKYKKIIRTEIRLCFSIVLLMQLLSGFLLFSAIPLMYNFVDKISTNKDDPNWEKFKSTSVLRGFSLSTLWLISSPTFTYSVDSMNASIWYSLLQGVVFLLFGVGLSVVFLNSKVNRNEIDRFHFDRREEESNHASSTLIELILLFILFFGLIIILYVLTNIELMVIIPISCVIIALFYYGRKEKRGVLMFHFKDYFLHKSISLSYQVCVMMSAGVLVFSLRKTTFENIIIENIEKTQDVLPVINIMSIIPVIMVLLGFMGLGPLTATVLIAGILSNMSISYPPELLVLSITMGNAISILISPLVIPVVLLSGINGMSTIYNGIRLNLKYAICLYMLSQLYLQGIFIFFKIID